MFSIEPLIAEKLQKKTIFLLVMLMSIIISTEALASVKPLKLYWSAKRGDNFTTATEQGEKAALAAGYRFARTEGFVFPVHKLK